MRETLVIEPEMRRNLTTVLENRRNDMIFAG